MVVDGNVVVRGEKRRRPVRATRYQCVPATSPHIVFTYSLTTTSRLNLHTWRPRPTMDVNLHPPDDYSHRFFIWHEWIQVSLLSTRARPVGIHIIYPRHMVLSQQRMRSSISRPRCSMTSRATTKSCGCRRCILGRHS